MYWHPLGTSDYRNQVILERNQVVFTWHVLHHLVLSTIWLVICEYMMNFIGDWYELDEFDWILASIICDMNYDIATGNTCTRNSFEKRYVNICCCFYTKVLIPSYRLFYFCHLSLCKFSHWPWNIRSISLWHSPLYAPKTWQLQKLNAVYCVIYVFIC